MRTTKAAAATAIRMRIMTFPPSEAICGRPSFRRFVSAAGAHPALRQGVVGLLGIDPCLAVGVFDLLPKRGPGLEVVHEELGGGEGRLSMRRRGDDQHDVFAGCQAAVTMDDGRTKQ